MKSKGILSSTIKVSIAVFITKVLGLLKQSIIASRFGAVQETDAYFLASGTVNNLSILIFSALSITLLTMHTERLISDGRPAANNLINAVLRCFIPIAAGITCIFVLLAPEIAEFLAPACSTEQRETLTAYIRILSPTFIFSCYYLVINVILETDKRFLPGKGQGLLQNICVIAAVLLLHKKFGIQAALYAFLIAGLLHGIQITRAAGKVWNFHLRTGNERYAIGKLCMLALPLLLGNATYEINDIVDKRIAAGLGEGSVSVLSFGASVNEIVTTLIVTSATAVLFSSYAGWAAEGKKDKINEGLMWSLKILYAVIVPIMVVCFLCGDSIIDILYGRGSFSYESVRNTAGVVICYAAGFFFQGTRADLIRVYYAFQDTRTPMITGAVAVTVNIILSIIFSRSMGVSGIALATSLSMLLATILLIPGIKKKLPGSSVKPLIGDLMKCTICGLAAFAIGWHVRTHIGGYSLITLLSTGAAVLFIYTALLFLLRVGCAELAKEMIVNKLSHREESDD